MFLGMGAGWLVGDLTGIVPSSDFLYGLQWDFKPFSVFYALLKTVVFAFFLTTVPSYHGFYTRGGALEVGRQSTKAVVYSSIVILVVNYLLTQMLLI